MADAVTLAKLPTEKVSDFNKRLRQACDDSPITDAQILIVDGEPLVTLFSELVEATVEDVAEGKAEKVGEEMPEEDPVIVQVSRATCETAEDAAKTQSFMERLYQRADGEVVELLHAQGFRAGWSEAPDKRSHWVQIPVTYLLVSYLADQDDEGEGEGDDKGMEDRLRQPANAER